MRALAAAPREVDLFSFSMFSCDIFSTALEKKLTSRVWSVMVV